MVSFAAIKMIKENSEEEEEEVEYTYYGFRSHRAPLPEGTAVKQPFMSKLVSLFTHLKFRKNRKTWRGKRWIWSAYLCLNLADFLIWTAILELR